MNTEAYADALLTVTIASSKFRKAQHDYRARLIDDEEFLAARAVYKNAEAQFDAIRGESAP